MEDHALWVRLLGGNGAELFRERKRDNRKRGVRLYVLDHNNLPSNRELLGQLRPLGGMGECSFPERAGGDCERPLGQDPRRAKHGESLECSRELVTTGSGTMPGLGSGTQKHFLDTQTTCTPLSACQRAAKHRTESKP